jgi:hypothetical protein
MTGREAVRDARRREANMRKSGNPNLWDYSDDIARALQTKGGHLSVGRGGFMLWFGCGARLSGYDCEHIKACCIAAGLPVIDSRVVAFEDVVRLAVRGPMVAVGEEASPPPYLPSFSFGHLALGHQLADSRDPLLFRLRPLPLCSFLHRALDLNSCTWLLISISVSLALAVNLL